MQLFKAVVAFIRSTVYLGVNFAAVFSGLPSLIGFVGSECLSFVRNWLCKSLPIKECVDNWNSNNEHTMELVIVQKNNELVVS